MPETSERTDSWRVSEHDRRLLAVSSAVADADRRRAVPLLGSFVGERYVGPPSTYATSVARLVDSPTDAGRGSIDRSHGVADEAAVSEVERTVYGPRT